MEVRNDKTVYEVHCCIDDKRSKVRKFDMKKIKGYVYINKGESSVNDR